MEGLNCKLTRSVCYGGIKRILAKAEERDNPNATPSVHLKAKEFNRQPLTWTAKISERLITRRLLSQEDQDNLTKLIVAIDSFDEDANAPLGNDVAFGYHMFNALMADVDKLLEVQME